MSHHLSLPAAAGLVQSRKDQYYQTCSLLPGCLERTLAELVRPGRDYSEQDVSRVLLGFNDDVATLRRGLVEHKLMRRAQGIYRRTA